MYPQQLGFVLFCIMKFKRHLSFTLLIILELKINSEPIRIPLCKKYKAIAVIYLNALKYVYTPL